MKKNKIGRDGFLIACGNGHIEIIKLLIENSKP